MLTIAYEHQDAGRPAYIVTAAAQELAEVLAQVMAFDGAIGSTLSGVKDGVYTGKATGEFLYRDAKARAITALAARDGIDLAASYAYSDSASDLPMLRVVGHAVVVNPDAELEALARENGWEVLRLDRLGRRLTTTAAILVAASAAGVTTAVLTARAKRAVPSPPPPPPRWWRRHPPDEPATAYERLWPGRS
jgi:hypothetical protein